MISKRSLLYVVFGATIAVTGCAPDLEVLEKTQPQPGDAFTEALAEDYKVLAQEDYKDASYPQADMFARKGLGAAGGEMVQPIDPIKAEVPPENVQELAHARSMLADLFQQGADQKVPERQAGEQVWREGPVVGPQQGAVHGAQHRGHQDRMQKRPANAQHAAAVAIA